jgi:hypothetical protein
MPRKATVTPIKKAAAKKAAAVKKATTTSKPAHDELEGNDWFVPLDETIDWTNSLLYGREGSGKTTDACFLANVATSLGYGKDEGRVLVINAEGGLKKRALAKRGIDTSRIVLWPDPKKHERVTHQSLDRIYRRVKSDLEANPRSWFGTVFDSASEIHLAILDTVQAKRVYKIEMLGKDVDPDFVDISDYGTMSKLFRDVMRKFRDLPCHFVVTALERRDVDKDTGKPQYGPAVTPGIQGDLLGYVDFVLMCKAEDEDGPFRALTRANSRYRAKDRFDVLPKVLANPTLERILLYLTDELVEDNDPDQKLIPIKVDKKKGKKSKDDEEEDEDGDDE